MGRLVAHDQAAVVVLDRAGEDFAGTGAKLAREHDQRAVPDDARIDIVVGTDLLVRILDLHHWALVDEQARQLDRLRQRAAAVAPQIEHHAVDALLAEVLEEPLAVAGAAFELRLALLGAGHVEIEARQVDHANLVGRAVGLLAVLDHLATSFGVLEFDLRPGDVVDLGHVLTDGNHLEADGRAPLAPDQLHDLVQVHVDDIDDLAFRTLAHTDHAILGLEPAVFVGRAARSEFHDRGVAVLALELGADAIELQPHPDLEVLQGAGGHVAGVRIETAGERREVGLEQLVGRHLVPPLGEAAIAAQELVLRLLG